MIVPPQNSTVIFRHMLEAVVDHFEVGASLFSLDECGFVTPRTTFGPMHAARWKQSLALAPASRRTADLTLIERFQQFVVSTLEHATSKDELVSQVDTLLDDEQYWEYRHHAHVQIQILQAGQTAADEPGCELADVLGAENGRALKRISTLVHELHKAHAKIVVWRENHALRTPASSQDKLAFLTDRQVPAEMKEALLADLRVEPLAAAINWLAGTPGTRQRVRAMLEAMQENVSVALRFLASIPFTDVPEEVVPIADRRDIAAIVARHEAREKHYQHSLATARAHDFAVFPPLEAVADGG